MGFLMLAGMIGSILYSGHVVKEELKAECIDNAMKPTFDSDKNEEKIRNRFNYICKRCRISTDKYGDPYNADKLNVAVEYLKLQGYSPSDIEYFKRYFKRRVEDHKNQIKNDEQDTKKVFEKKFNNDEATEMVVFNVKIYNSYLKPEKRMNILLENDFWNTIVEHHSYIGNNRNNTFEEIWTLKVPRNFFKNDKQKRELYKIICREQGVEYKL